MHKHKSSKECDCVADTECPPLTGRTDGIHKNL